MDKPDEASIIPDKDNARASAWIPKERDVEKQSAASLKKGIKSLEAQIERHKDKIAHPEKYVYRWHELPKEAQDGLIRHWQREIRNFETSIHTRTVELNGRGE